MMGEGEEGMDGRKDERSEGGKGEGGKGEGRKDLMGTGHGITLGATKHGGNEQQRLEESLILEGG